jgi:hypothetical protein
MNFDTFAQIFLGQCLGLALLWVVVSRALPVGIQQFMKDSILSKRSGRFTRRD